jgi:hypothetical protein
MHKNSENCPICKILAVTKKSWGYSRGHEGDPQYEISSQVRFTVPENFYGLKITDKDQKTIDDISFKNKEDYEDFNDEDGLSNKDQESWLKLILKDLPEVSKWVIKKIKENKNLEPYELFLDRNEGNDEIVSELIDKFKNEAEVTVWLKNEITKDFKKFSDDSDNWIERKSPQPGD